LRSRVGPVSRDRAIALFQKYLQLGEPDERQSRDALTALGWSERRIRAACAILSRLERRHSEFFLMRTIRILAMLAAFSAGMATRLQAQPVLQAKDATYEDIPIAGGTAAIASLLEIERVPDRARFVAELARLIHDVPEGRNAATDAVLQRLADHFEVIDRFQALLTGVQPGGKGVSLTLAANKDGRAKLHDFLTLVGLKLKEKNKAFTVEPLDKKTTETRLKILSRLGVDLTSLASSLNAGKAVKIEIPIESVPVPLTAALWQSAILHKPVPTGRLFGAIMSDRDAAMLCYGLAGTDVETRRFLATHPAMLTRLYEHDAAAFGAFGAALRIADGRVMPEGGPAAAQLWKSLVGEPLDRPESFVRELFSRDDGAIAHLYDILFQLDPARRAFALGLWIPDAAERLDRFRALAAVAQKDKAWDIKRATFVRRPVDVGLMLARIYVEPDGRPAPPAARLFWQRIFDGADLPDDPARRLRKLGDSEPIDAAWLADRVIDATALDAEEALDQFIFGQRAFRQATAAQMPDALVALRAYTRYRTLLLTLERMGLTAPATYAAAARHADRIAQLDPTPARIALQQYQGSLALLARLRLVHRIDAATATRLIEALVSVPLVEGPHFHGGVARWLRDARTDLTLTAPGDIGTALIDALAGASPSGSGRAETATLLWEGQRYHLDLFTPEKQRLTDVYRKLETFGVSSAMALLAVTEQLDRADVTIPQIRQGEKDLKSIAEALPRINKKSGFAVPAGVEIPADPAGVILAVAKNLSRLSKPKDAQKARHTVQNLYETVDVLLGDALAALAYAVDLGSNLGGASLIGQESRRHDFGFTAVHASERHILPWAEPVVTFSTTEPWHLRGSLLALSVTLARTRLHRTNAAAAVAAPLVLQADRDRFAAAALLMNPLDLKDADLHELANAVTRGRARVAALRGQPETLDALAAEINMDGWRTAALRWMLEKQPDRLLSLFALSELVTLGRFDPLSALEGWGAPPGLGAICLCTEWPRPGHWRLLMGRPQTGLMSSQVTDLTINVALALEDLHLPAALLPAVLREAVLDYVDSIRPLYHDDWLAFEQAAQSVTRRQIEDYVAALTASGPLAPSTAVNRAPR
jgi:hypothetical protein